MSALHRLRRAIAPLIVAFGVAACTDPSEPPQLTQMTLSMPSTTVVTGQAVAVTPLPIDQFGVSMPPATIDWSSTAPSIATVSAAGVVTGVAPGSAAVVATSGGLTTQLTITVVGATLSSLTITIPSLTLMQGQTAAATANGLDQLSRPLASGRVTWVSGSPTVATVDSLGNVRAVAPGTSTLTATVGTISAQRTITVTALPAIRITEVESNGGTPGDWTELFNPTATAVDISGWSFKDNDNTRTFAFPAGTLIPAGGYYVVEEAAFGFGLGAADEARLFSQYGVLVDSYAWTAHAATTYGRCPSVTGAVVTTAESTKGAANDCRVLVVVNEVESNGGTPGDWIELYNRGTTVVNLSGFVVKDNDDSRTTTLPAGTTIAAGGFLVIEEAQLGFGLGAADAARLFDPSGTLVDSYTWTAHATTTFGRCPDGTGPFSTTAFATKSAANDCRSAVRINEVESNGGTPGDWIELYNAGSTAVDLSNFLVKDNDDTRTTRLPAGATIAPGGYYVIEEDVLGFGLGAGDAARIFDANGTLLDSYTWTAHATITYGRCPNGTGDFADATASTKGAANSCTPVTGPTTSPWPGSDDVQTVDGTAVFGGNLSGLTYEAAGGGQPAVLWAARNGPGSIFRLVFSGGIWTPDATNGWSAGKLLRYPDGLGEPDAEGITLVAGAAGGGVYVASERNNSANSVSRNSILRFDATAAGSTLTATHEWNLTADLPAVGANLGIEAITWIPDSMLVANGFYDESKARAYAPADYASHGTGLFFVGVEANGTIYAYALNHATNSATRVATIVTGFPGVMGMEYDRDTGYLWATCDDGCGNTTGVLQIDVSVASPTRGRFLAPRRYARPSTLPNINNEGFAFAPQSSCVAGRKSVFWADDSETAGHSIRSATIPCATFPRAPINFMRTRGPMP
ncbi:lamin tail domain-containing protein [Gemmatimonas groenlandica]|uniref:lamin tail domain-containing protein n=1 Tax=Gemmatimonas groenlandica TaxID=2732249 RepID=UPI001982388F|nr:lamin tail domain-containing protein [Gemmatimonas groenlandica]